MITAILALGIVGENPPAPSAEPLWELVPPVEYGPCGLPDAQWGAVLPRDPIETNAVGVEAGLLSWNGLPVDETMLRQYIEAASMREPQPRIILYGDSAECPQLRRIAAMIAGNGLCDPGYCFVALGRVPRTAHPPAPPAPPMYVAPPPPPEPHERKARPREDPRGWVTSDDYPAGALRAEQAGSVTFRIEVDETGAITDCVVTGSSGSAILDNATCNLMKRRGTFLPGTDARGKPTASSWVSRMRWELPDPVLFAVTSFSYSLRFTLNSTGNVVDCREQRYGTPDLWTEDACPDLEMIPAANLQKLRGKSRGPVTIIVRFDHVVDGIAMPSSPLIPSSYRVIETRRATFEIDERGRAVNCQGGSVYSEVPISTLGCGTWERYVPGERRYSAMVNLTVVTSGDPNVVDALRALED